MIVVVGSGVAGLAAALAARGEGKEVLVIHRGWTTGSTHHAQGGIAAALRDPDTPEAHARDTLRAGQGLASPEAVRILTREGPAMLRHLGLPLHPSPAREGGHGHARVWHTGHDRFGLDLQRFLRRKAREAGVRFLHGHVRGLGLRHGEVVGVWVATTWIPADAVVLATGGYAALWRTSTNPPGNVGEGLWMALHAGARLRNLELVQFHPTWLAQPPHGLISETVRGAGARLRNVWDEPFMHRYHPQGDLAPRDVVTRAIMEEMRRTRAPYVLLDLSPIPRDRFAQRFPHIYPRVASFWPRVPVRPAAHYTLGGIVVDTWGHTGVPRLLAAGETTWSGVHGANRLGSNSLLEGLVWGMRAGLAASRLPPQKALLPAPSTPPPPSNPSRWQGILDRYVGPVRRGEALQTLAEGTLPDLSGLPGWLIQAALLRRESRGVHVREDFPDPAPEPYHLDLRLTPEGRLQWDIVTVEVSV